MSDLDRGPLVLVGGSPWHLGAWLGEQRVVQPDGEILVLPTAAAYEHPDQATEAVAASITGSGIRATACPVLRRADAERAAFADRVRSARCCLLLDGSPLHLRSVLKDSLVLHALVNAWCDGAAIVGVGAGAMVLTDPMVDPRGGAFTVGLGLVRDLAVLPGYTGESTPQVRRTLALAPENCPVVALGPASGVERSSDGSWRQIGEPPAEVFIGRRPGGLEELAGKPLW